MDQTTKSQFAKINLIINDLDPKNYRVLQAIHQYVVDTPNLDKIPLHIVEQFRRISFMSGDIFKLALAKNAFDGIIADNVLHLFTPHQIIDFYQAVNLSLKLNGILKITTKTPYFSSYIKKQRNILPFDPEIIESTYGKPNDPYLMIRDDMCMAAYCDIIAPYTDFIHLNPAIFPDQLALNRHSDGKVTFLRKETLKLLGNVTNINLLDSEYFSINSLPEDNSKSIIELEKDHDYNKEHLAGIHQKTMDLPVNHKKIKELHASSDNNDKKYNDSMKDNYIYVQRATGDVFYVDKKSCSNKPLGAQIIKGAQEQWAAGKEYYERSKQDKK